ncbi:MAG: SMC-Scp complex subunit ScpB [Leptolyngbya sp. PLA3]|nr:MAG: SMC-Scp complex subunit ScpB [Cyanobacteria bacterium CYA]MCE7968591.1 SMC-Scp complex subunit ScpB [Leptolyngbya sp. PL-A3]
MSGPSSAVDSPEASNMDAGNPTIQSAVEAILFSVDRAVPASRIVEALAAGGRASDEAGVIAAIDELNEVYRGSGRSFRIEPVAGGFRVMTLPEHAPVLAAFRQARSAGRLTRAALETLAIIAYEQPLTRARLEAIRGVACGEVLRTLIDRKLITVKGRAEELGRPMLYGTTRQFLDAFGLSSTRDLPTAEELRNADWLGGQA